MVDLRDVREGDLVVGRDGTVLKVQEFFKYCCVVRPVDGHAIDTYAVGMDGRYLVVDGEHSKDVVGVYVEESSCEPAPSVYAVAYLWTYYQDDSVMVSGITLTREFAEEIMKNDKPYGYKGTITPLYPNDELTEEFE